MDPVINPFAPGAGSPPPELAGRKEILDQAAITLARVARGRAAKSVMVVGLRGVGKTVLLNRVRANAEDQSYLAEFLETPENKSLAAVLAPALRSLILKMDRGERLNYAAKRAFRVLRSWGRVVRLKYNDVEISLDGETEEGIADSGDLESDVSELLVSVAEAAKERGSAAVIIIDELQYLSELEMSALIMGMHRVSQRQLPLVLFGAGLPQLVGLTGRSKSYAERLFDFPQAGPLAYADLGQPCRRQLSQRERSLAMLQPSACTPSPKAILTSCKNGISSLARGAGAFNNGGRRRSRHSLGSGGLRSELLPCAL